MRMKKNGKNFKVKKTRIQPGMLLFEPAHRTGVMSALTGYFRGKKRKRGYRRTNKQSKSTGANVVRPEGHYYNYFEKTLDSLQG